MDTIPPYRECMPTYVVRVWLPDRPGALGAVASRIGAVRGDLTGVEILERGAGRAIDELVVSIPRADLLDLMIQEVAQVDGVDVEDVRPIVHDIADPRLDALETAALLVTQQTVEDLLQSLAAHVRHDFGAAWCSVIDVAEAVALATEGVAPSAPWLEAFVAGSRSSLRVAAGECGPDDVAWASLPTAELAVVAGRDGRPFRSRERRQLAALARIADARWGELLWRTARQSHPATPPVAITSR